MALTFSSSCSCTLSFLFTSKEGGGEEGGAGTFSSPKLALIVLGCCSPLGVLVGGSCSFGGSTTVVLSTELVLLTLSAADSTLDCEDGGGSVAVTGGAAIGMRGIGDEEVVTASTGGAEGAGVLTKSGSS